MSIYSLSLKQPKRIWYITQPFNGADWMTRAVRMAAMLSHELWYWWQHDVCVCDSDTAWAFVETPDNWFTDKGMDSKNAGDIQKLYWFVGHLVGVLADCPLALHEIWTVVPKAWKGQTPKDIMVTRAMAVLKDAGLMISLENPLPHDAAEAVLLARNAAARIHSQGSSKLGEGKGWARVWSSNLDIAQLKIRTWP